LSRRILWQANGIHVKAKPTKCVLLLTGSPGTGKTTVLRITVGLLKENSVTVGGMISSEIREEGKRIGFEIQDLSSGKRGWLAHINQQTGPFVGKYRVNLQNLNDIGAEAILNAVATCDVIVIDEIGPMELYSEKFKAAVRKALASPKSVIAVIHWKARDKLINETKKMKEAEIFTVTKMNRQNLSRTLAQKTLETNVQTTCAQNSENIKNHLDR
jgi:nucleoside-triphosphatase